MQIDHQLPTELTTNEQAFVGSSSPLLGQELHVWRFGGKFFGETYLEPRLSISWCFRLGHGFSGKNYFTSSDPHHDMSGGGCQVRVVIYF